VQLRIARHTERLDGIVGFYRDGIGLTEIGGFRDHDGVFLAVPGTGAHFELTAGGGRTAPAPHPKGRDVSAARGPEVHRAVRRGIDVLGREQHDGPGGHRAGGVHRQCHRRCALVVG
jgi:hypothetical protein